MKPSKKEPYPVTADTAQNVPPRKRNYDSLSRAYSVCSDIADGVDAFLSKPPIKLKLGIDSIDEVLNNGLFDEFCLIYGLAGRGKTDFLINVLAEL